MFEFASNAQSLLNNPESIVFDSDRNRYLVSNWGDGAIIQIDSSGHQSYFNIELLNKYRVAGLYIYGDTLLAAAGDSPTSGIFGFNIETSEIVFQIPIPGIGLPNDIASDADGIIYVTDYWDNKLYKIKDHSPSIFISKGVINSPNGILYDPNYNRLLVLSVGGTGAPIIAINLKDSSCKTIVETGLIGTDGITLDSEGRIYVSEWTNDQIYLYDCDFNNPPEIFSKGHNDPADIYYDETNDLLAVPNFTSNTIDYIPLNAALGFELK
jgi:DNA-binding beta-propeller fold protein YncE